MVKRRFFLTSGHAGARNNLRKLFTGTPAAARVLSAKVELACPSPTLFHPAVFKTAPFLKFWLPVLAWMAVIFFASGDQMSSQHTSRFLGPLIHRLFPALSDTAIAEIVFTLRKTAHVTEYAVLALLLWRACRKPVPRDARPWKWSLARLALLASALYAATDELHQCFVPNREARISDVALDTAGAACALLLLWLIGRWRRYW
jgi:VanZ family protein